MAFGAPSPTGVFIANSDVSRQIRIDYARNIADFPVNRYHQMVPGLKKEAGYFLRIKPNQNFRVRFNDLRNNVWHDGADRPRHQGNQKLFEWARYDTTRYDFGYTIGKKAVDQADFDIEPIYAGMASQQAMTAKTILALAALADADWQSNTAAVGTLVSDATKHWGNGTASNPVIKNALLKAAIIANKLTGGVVKPSDLVLQINPELARNMAISEEIHAYLKESEYSHRIQEGTINQKWGLPDKLYGHELVIEDAVQDTSQEGGTDAPRYILDDDVAHFLSRPGGLVGKAGAPAFSTLTAFHYGPEMDVESKYDEDNRRVEGHVGMDVDLLVTTTLGGFRFTDCLG